MGRDLCNQKSLGNTLNTLIKAARVLLVGAGGIGCELLKNLALAGFGEIHIVDLDTIDISNLNRQFLFRHEHIKKSKALVAKEAACQFNPNVKLEAYMANIHDSKFDIDWFKGFNIVFNALDNLQARRHVNKMCIAADVPLIESGTMGFNGQVQVIKKGVTACYDCTPKVTPKSFPICTIRSTPSQPIHCIVWAKSYLLNEIFGASEEEQSDMDSMVDRENKQEIENLRREAMALRKIRESMGCEEFAQLLFNKAYKHDVERLLSMDDLWKTRRAPEALDYNLILSKATEEGFSAGKVLQDMHIAWNVEESLVAFKHSLERLGQRMQHLRSTASDGSAEPIITFDKDDEDTLDFVTASANLRSSVFGIERKSKFDVKQMAGNIIPAIATTNAIVAGLCVLQSFKVLQEDFPSAKEVFLSPFATERLLASDRCQTPNPDCSVCSVAYNRVLIDLSRTTLNDLVELFLKAELGYGEELTVNDGENHLLYDIDETVNLEKKLTDLGVGDRSFLTVMDEDDIHPDGPRVNLVLTVHDSTMVDGKRIKSLDIPIATENKQPLVSLLYIPRRKPKIQTPADTSLKDSNKRPLTPDPMPRDLAKKPKIGSTEPTSISVKSNNTSSDVVIEIYDNDDGAIMID
ncbi:BgTH12-05296 [Blumeria graminis f. sp. triticale]|uniref:Ubiquitin-activating enzyme E1-like n=3 Tax=Blumeria graminis TaxID=34373 RepID=A0A381LE31_BLUGR|nr:hypothetical protein BGT96224_4887 [Blumeria graminis f. sp. tritici 96224]CAD6502706.1 BgTH12-05296 [Blumeria graminis f. sp. triticale]VDB88139.1 Bgt-4887 [Blumeria graminis f. sp. tritici]